MSMDLKLKQRASEYSIRKGASVSVNGLDLTSEEVRTNRASASERVLHRFLEVWQVLFGELKKYARRVLDSQSSNNGEGERRRAPRRDNRRRRARNDSQPTLPSVETHQQRKARSATDLEALEESGGQ
uniref:Uncharacterized protein n=1 Tax=Trichogramma kaykai TaxID=54128 RepID=A0ABD2W714_9HYME